MSATIDFPTFLPTLPAAPAATVTDLPTWQIWQIQCEVALRKFMAQLAQYSVSQCSQPVTDQQRLLELARSLIQSSAGANPTTAIFTAQQILANWHSVSNFSPAPV